MEEDEFIGEEVCAIYDTLSHVIAIQNNRYSLSYNGMSMFLLNFMDTAAFKKFCLEPLTYPEKYTNISDDGNILYKRIA